MGSPGHGLRFRDRVQPVIPVSSNWPITPAQHSLPTAGCHAPADRYRFTFGQQAFGRRPTIWREPPARTQLAVGGRLKRCDRATAAGRSHVHPGSTQAALAEHADQRAVAPSARSSIRSAKTDAVRHRWPPVDAAVVPCLGRSRTLEFPEASEYWHFENLRCPARIPTILRERGDTMLAGWTSRCQARVAAAQRRIAHRRPAASQVMVVRRADSASCDPVHASLGDLRS